MKIEACGKIPIPQASNAAKRIDDASAQRGEMASQRLDDEAYMRIALAQAAHAASLGEVPIGAVVVYDPVDPATRSYINEAPRVIAQGCNLRESANDPTGHAELLAMKKASDELGVWRLTGCTVYVTLEPCIMCAGLMHQARVDRCVFGASDKKAGALGTLYHVNADERLNHTFPVTPGVLEEECAGALKAFFKQRRSERKKQKQCALDEAKQNDEQVDRTIDE